MAVAEKTLTAAAAARDPRQTLLVHCALGALYVLASLWLVFLAMPTFWRMLDVDSLLTEKPNEFLAGALLLLVTIPTIFGLFVGGRMLEGPHPVHGLRAGTFYLATCVLFFGLIATAGSPLWATIGLALLVCSVLLFFVHPGFLNWLVRCEDQGWLHASSYKPNQGVRVRRTTVIAIMVLILCGVYTLTQHGSLRTGTWRIARPFTDATVEVEALQTELAKLESRLKQNELTKSEAKEQMRLAREKLDKANRRGWALAVDPWMVTAPFGDARWVFMYQISLTVPILTLIVCGWFAWRLVNWPVFADFLIATEAEMNKVSWTTKKRLYQDTIVVLVTVFLLTTFLFVVDICWIKILTWGPIDVLKHNPQDVVRKQQSGAQW